MEIRAFGEEQLRTVDEALGIAEEVTGEHYRFTDDQWKRHPYDVRTLRSLGAEEIPEQAFALLSRLSPRVSADSELKRRDAYVICLQDHRILNAVARDRALALLPLLLYIFTHELVHIIRFSNFSQRFTVDGRVREEEERIVHGATFDILARLRLPRLAHVLEVYRAHRFEEALR